MKTLDQRYEEWWAETAPVGVQPIQKRECKKAFYCGAAAFMFSVSELVDDTNVSMSEADKGADALQDELNQFFEQFRTNGK